MNSHDRILLEARDYSVRAERAAAMDLSHNIDAYMQPSWTVRKVLDGYVNYSETGLNDEETYSRFREAFTETHGVSNRVFSNVIAEYIPKQEFDLEQSTFEFEGDRDLAVKTGLYHLKKFGFYKTKMRAPAEFVESLKRKIFTALEKQNGEALAAVLEGREDAELQLKLNELWLSSFDEMYAMAADPILLSTVQEYMGVPPIFNTPVALLNSARRVRNNRELSDTAQLYHHDLHRLKFVKLFIYLTDVEKASGPHMLIRNTHRSRPAALWNDGRHNDQVVKEAGLMDDEVSITGPAGTIFLVDTSCLHKGAHPTEQFRLMAQVQYTNSLFGRPWRQSERKIIFAAQDKNTLREKAADLVRKYAGAVGVRFMQNLI